MTRKNINVSEIVHEKLSLRKRKEETFDDVLKREFGILPEGIDDLVAFYPKRLASAAQEIIDIIEKQAEFEKRIVEYEDYYALEFNHPESGHTIVQAQFMEELDAGMIALYRDNQGDMERLAVAQVPEEAIPLISSEEWAKLSSEEQESVTEEYGESAPVYIGPSIDDSYYDWPGAPLDGIKSRLQSKISGSYERWG